MDSDCFASSQWLSAGVAAFHEGLGLVQGRTMPDPKEKLGIFKWYVRVEEESFFYHAANIFYRRAAFLQAGGFPADLTPAAAKPMGGEDVALAWQVKRKGWKSSFADDALVFHELLPLAVWHWI